MSKYQEIEQATREAGIGWYRKYAAILSRDRCCIVLNVDFTARVYILDDDDCVDCIAPHITRHRAKQVAAAIHQGKWDGIDEEVRQNYITNGYTTRRGLYADYSKQLEHITRIHLSHIICDDSGTEGHNIRQNLRRQLDGTNLF